MLRMDAAVAGSFMTLWPIRGGGGMLQAAGAMWSPVSVQTRQGSGGAGQARDKVVTALAGAFNLERRCIGFFGKESFLQDY
jgi:hypothetical protein